MSKKHMLITGGQGFVGTNLVNTLKDKDDYVITTLDLKNVSLYPSVEGNITHYIGDFTDNDTLHTIFTKFRDTETPITTVIHLAGQVGVPDSYNNPYRDANINIMGTLRLLDFCSHFNVERFILASSTAVIGDGLNLDPGTTVVDEETYTLPNSPYGISKLAGEHYLRSKCITDKKMNGVSLRFSNIYGSYSDTKSSVIHKFIRDAFEYGKIVIDGDGKQSRDFIYVEDVCRAIVRAATFNDAYFYRMFNIASGKSMSILSLALKIVELFRFKYDKIVDIKYGKSRIGEVGKVLIDPSSALYSFNWESHTPIESGLYSTIMYYEDKYSNVSRG